MGSGGGGSVSDNDDMIRDIFSRLPVKSLMRFKCVCKHLQYLIEEDEYLIDLHYKRSKTRPGLIIIVPRFYLATPESRYYALSKEISFLSADIVLGENGNATGAIVHTVRNAKDDTFKCTQTSYMRDYRIQYNQILKPVNGLICFVYWTPMYMSTVTFCLYNASTREIMIVKNSISYRETRRDEQYESCRTECTSFQLGFDPVTKEHKLIAVFTVRKDKLWSGSAAYTVCEALTLGNNTWRRMDGVQLCNFPRNSVSVNGSIYWHCTTKLSRIKYSGGFEWYKDEECPSIVAFDVGNEKFRVIPIPGFMLDKSYAEKEKGLLAVDERLAYFAREIVSRRSGYEYRGNAKLWIFDDHHQKENKTAGSNMNWTEEMILLPSDWESYFVKCHDIARSDHLILTCYNCSEFVSIHSYNREKKTFSKIEISGIGYVPDILYTYLFTTFVESLFRVNKKQQQQQQQSPQIKEMTTHSSSRFKRSIKGFKNAMQ